MKRLLILALVCALSGFALPSRAEDPRPRASLLIIGGALRPDNGAIFQRLIASAGGREAARFVIFPAAAKSDRPARQFQEILVDQGIAREHITIVDLTPENAERQAADPQVVHQIRSASAAFLVGGDQVRIVRSLLKPDRTPTPALVALQEMWRGGGVIAGSSAGAAVQSIRMLSVAGLPDELLDQGMDVLDFGICANQRRRGLLVTEGLGFFAGGIVDQHFNQYRGRLARLSRALIHEHVRFGFGIDEDTAMAVSPDGSIEVVGHGSLTIVDAAAARLTDNSLGCHLRGLKVTYLQAGDRFDPATGSATVRPEKKLLDAKSQDYNGNFLVTDMGGPASIPWAICFGLAENTSRKQDGVTLRYSRSFGHGYHFTLAKTEQTRTYGGYVDHFYSYAAVDLQLDVHPILADLQTPQTSLPIDLPEAAARLPLEALWFRGILLADEQRRLRPTAAITRAELAGALAQTVHLKHLRAKSPTIQDVAGSAAEFEDVSEVVAAGLMTLDAAGRFRPQDAVTREEAATSLVGLLKFFVSDPPQAPAIKLKDEAQIAATSLEAVYAAIGAGLMRPDDEHFRPASSFTRQDAAVAICQVIGFDWNSSPAADAGK